MRRTFVESNAIQEIGNEMIIWRDQSARTDKLDVIHDLWLAVL